MFGDAPRRLFSYQRSRLAMAGPGAYGMVPLSLLGLDWGLTLKAASCM
jgi:hypothetical protein